MNRAPEEPIRTHDDLLAVIFEAMKPAAAYRIGPEMEKFGVYAGTGDPLPYAGDRGVLRLLEDLETRFGWTPERETEGGPLIALKKGHGSITLEPGGQFELSGAAVTDVHQVCAEFREHLAELAPISAELGIRWLGLGFHPFARREDLSWVPKLRYGIMRTYLPTRGGKAIDMMLRTSTVQANYDFSTEADAMRKMRVALRLSPLTTALFANSPFCEDGLHGGLTYRGQVWLDVNPDRSGLVPALWRENATIADYVEWALDVPMFMFKRNGEKKVNTGQTFRAFWKEGFEGHKPTFSDWETHLNTLFPEVRLKRTIEIRGADAQAAPFACALPALWTGIFYDEKALAEAEALTADWTHDEVAESRRFIWKDGLRAAWRGADLVAVASRVLEIADGGLERRGRKSSKGNDERVHLARVKELAHHGRSPAHLLIDDAAHLRTLAPAAFRAAVMDRADLTKN